MPIIEENVIVDVDWKTIDRETLECTGFLRCVFIRGQWNLDLFTHAHPAFIACEFHNCDFKDFNLVEEIMLRCTFVNCKFHSTIKLHISDGTFLSCDMPPMFDVLSQLYPLDGVVADRLTLSDKQKRLVLYGKSTFGQLSDLDWHPDMMTPEDYYAMNNPSYQWMSVELMNRYVPLARRLGVSDVARGAGGFVPTYRRAGSPKNMPEAWVRKRAGFIARHLAQGKKEGWWKNGEPTRRHLALIMWAYTPTPGRTLDYANKTL